MDLINGDIRISFDFDDTLSLPSVQKVAKELIEYGFDVIVVTSRKSDGENSDIEEVVQDLGIDIVFYTEYNLKYSHLNSLMCDIHIDNDRNELIHLSRFSDIVGIDVTNESWEYELKNILLCL
tara:strand:+ start:590 stop:958 length:369 start_codon:yes stop_codon:yes gene_type:complete